jgi:hypothetical protein
MTKNRNRCACGCGETTNDSPNGTPRTWRPGHNRRIVGSKGWVEAGYWYINVNGRKIAFHRWVVEQMLGRELCSAEVVHHVDGNPLNNDSENLVVLSRSEHHRLHATGSHRKRWSDDEKVRARDLHDAGMTIQQVSRVLARPFSSTAVQVRSGRV